MRASCQVGGPGEPGDTGAASAVSFGLSLILADTASDPPTLVSYKDPPACTHSRSDPGPSGDVLYVACKVTRHIARPQRWHSRRALTSGRLTPPEGWSRSPVVRPLSPRPPARPLLRVLRAPCAVSAPGSSACARLSDADTEACATPKPRGFLGPHPSCEGALGQLAGGVLRPPH